MAASPDNTQDTAVSLGTLTAGGAALTATGSNEGETSAWYSFTVPYFVSPANIAVIPADGGNEATLWTPGYNYPDGGPAPIGPATNMNESLLPGTNYVQVAGGTQGNSFTLTVTPPASD